MTNDSADLNPVYYQVLMQYILVTCQHIGTAWRCNSSVAELVRMVYQYRTWSFRDML